MKKMPNICKAALTWLIYGGLRAMPLPVGSAVGGWLARMLGPTVRVHRVADHNLRMAMPQLDAQQRKQVLRGMWDNLGRVFAEYPHLNSAAMRKRILRVNGKEYLSLERFQGRPVLFISGHLGNWELLALTAQMQGTTMHLLYRAANNPTADRLVAKKRASFCLGLHAKGKKGARAVITAMRRCEPVGILVDQKANDGIESMFMGHIAMTAPSVAELAVHYNPVIIPAFCRRLKGSHFEVDILPPIEFDAFDKTPQTMRCITDSVNELISQRIQQDPSQWFWVHKRWPFSGQTHR